MPKTQLPVIASLLLLFGNASCTDTATTLCATGIRCPVAQGCAAKDAVCITSPCGNGVIDIDLGEVCDDGGIENGDGCSANCLSVEICGNGIVDMAKGETCDDAGESVSCDTDCSIARCGDGTVNITSKEQCDIVGESAVCDTDCTFAFCGDGFLNEASGERCDHEGESAQCNVDCTFAECRDGVLNLSSGEECDDGGESNRCDANCTLATCSDGEINITRGEECDDVTETVSCDADCTAAMCRDGVVNAERGEQCDDFTETASCNFDCTNATCGDGYTNAVAGEQCDTFGETSECDTDCTVASCGDGKTNSMNDEECDDSGESSRCDRDCTLALCGDGHTNTTAQEECDDGAPGDGGNGCAADCLVTHGIICQPGSALGQLGNLGTPAVSTGFSATEQPFMVVGNFSKSYQVPRPTLSYNLIVPLIHTYDPDGASDLEWSLSWDWQPSYVEFSISTSRANPGSLIAGKILILGFDGRRSSITEGSQSGYLGGESDTLVPQEMIQRTKVAPITYLSSYTTNGSDDFSWSIFQDPHEACAERFTSTMQGGGGIRWYANLILLSEAVRVETWDFNLEGTNAVDENTFPATLGAERIWLPIVTSYQSGDADDLAYSVSCLDSLGQLICTARTWNGKTASQVRGYVLLLESLQGF